MRYNARMTEEKDKTQGIYLDYAAATPLDSEVYTAMEPYWRDCAGNAGALHAAGRAAKEAVERARVACAHAVDAETDEIIFTSGGTEGNNLAIFGLYERLLEEGRKSEEMHMVTISIEHSSVHDCFKALERKGVRISYVPVEKSGVVSPEAVLEAIEEDTVLVSVMLVNSEIGTIQPLSAIASGIAAKRKEHQQVFPYFHTDASQAPAYVSCGVDEHGVDMMTIDAQKMYGPKGVGFLYVRGHTHIAPLLYGGSQERGMRPGTPNTPLIVGLARALQLAEERRESRNQRLCALRDRLIDGVERAIPGAVLNGEKERRVSANANFSFPGIESESMLYALDAVGICVSARSACLGSAGGGSYVVRALGASEEEVLSAVRFSLGAGTTEENIEEVLSELVRISSALAS